MVLIDSPEQTQIIVCCFPTTDTGSSVSYVILYRYGIAYIAINWMYWAVICTWRATKPMSVGGAWLWSLTDICQVNGTGWTLTGFIPSTINCGRVTNKHCLTSHPSMFLCSSFMITAAERNAPDFRFCALVNLSLQSDKSKSKALAKSKASQDMVLYSD